MTPFLNAAEFIEEAIESVFAQTYRNWELLLVDDGSSDGSTEIAQRYAFRFPERIRYLEHPGHCNLGASASRNHGIKLSRGEYVAFLDADDVYLPQKLEQQVSILETHRKAGLVYSASHYWYGWTGAMEDLLRDRTEALGVQADSLYDPPSLLIAYLRKGASVPCTCGWLARLTVIEQIGGWEDAFRTLYDDQVFLAKMCLAAPVFVASGCWDKYRQHPGSTTARAVRKGLRQKFRPDPARLVFLDWLQDYLLVRDVQHPGLWRALRFARWPYRHPFLYALTVPVRSLRYRARRLLTRMSLAPAKRPGVA